jgi:hypothetical protein
MFNVLITECGQLFERTECIALHVIANGVQLQTSQFASLGLT